MRRFLFILQAIFLCQLSGCADFTSPTLGFHESRTCDVNDIVRINIKQLPTNIYDYSVDKKEETLVMTGKPYVQVTIRGVRLNLILDTGAATNTLNPRAVEKLGLAESQGILTIPLLNNRVKIMREFSLDANIEDFHLKDIKFFEDNTKILYEKGIDGVVGFDFLKVAAFKLDIYDNSLTLYPHQCDPISTINKSTWFWLPDQYTDVMSIAVKVDEQPLVAILDTGSPYSNVSKEFADKLGIAAKVLSDDPVLREHMFAGQHDYFTRRHVFSSLSIGPLTIGRVPLIITELDKKSEAGIGLDVLANVNIFKSPQSNEIFFQTNDFFLHL